MKRKTQGILVAVAVAAVGIVLGFAVAPQKGCTSTRVGNTFTVVCGGPELAWVVGIAAAIGVIGIATGYFVGWRMGSGEG